MERSKKSQSPPEDLQVLLTQLIINSLKPLGLDKAPPCDIILDLPEDSRFGDLSTNIALRLSKSLKRPPIEIALDLAKEIKSQSQRLLGPGHFIKDVRCEGAGFINFYLEDRYFYEQLKGVILRRGNFFRRNIGRSKRVLIEFVSANPTGPLSVAHARAAAMGDSLSSILGFLGFKVKREYYLNDEGNQINILGESVGLRLKELEGEKIEFPQNYYQGDYIYDIAKKAKSQKRKAKNLGDFAADYILKIIRKELSDFGIRFDYWYSQRKLRESGKINRALDFLKKKGFLYEQEGALWFKSTEFGDDKDRVVIKSDGAYTYLAPDIAYHWETYRRRFSWLINRWGPDHHGYINRLKASVCALGFPPDSLSIIIVQLATIFKEGKQIEMSTRKGQYITLREVLDEVGKDAARFFFLMRRASSHLDFDLDMAKKQTPENPVFYVQYAYARISSILRQANFKFSQGLDLSCLKEKEELGLLKRIWQFSYTLEICFKTQDPYMLTVYLGQLAKDFHKFYDRHRVLGQQDEITKARLALIEASRVAIGTGLDLLSVSKPQKM